MMACESVMSRPHASRSWSRRGASKILKKRYFVIIFAFKTFILLYVPHFSTRSHLRASEVLVHAAIPFLLIIFFDFSTFFEREPSSEKGSRFHRFLFRDYHV